MFRRIGKGVFAEGNGKEVEGGTNDLTVAVGVRGAQPSGQMVELWQ